MKYVTIAMLFLGDIVRISLIGEPRKPITRGEVAAGLVCSIILTLLILWKW